MSNARKRLYELESEQGFRKLIDCSPEENAEYLKLGIDSEALPDDVVYNKFRNVFCKYTETDLTQEEITRLNQLEQTRYLKLMNTDVKTIKLAVLIMIVCIIALMVSLSC